MFSSKINEQTILEFLQGDYISVTADSFLVNRKARELSRHTLRFYRELVHSWNIATQTHGSSSKKLIKFRPLNHKLQGMVQTRKDTNCGRTFMRTKEDLTCRQNGLLKNTSGCSQRGRGKLIK